MTSLKTTLSALALAATMAATAVTGAFAQGKGTVGIAMPTKSSARWIDDGNNIVKILKERGYGTDLQYAEDDIPNQLSQVENMVTKGAKVLVIAAIDGTTLSDVLKQAKAKGLVPPKQTTVPEHTGPGRPTDYRPEYCDFLIECAEAGESQETFCALVGIEYKTLTNWTAAHPEFLQAIGIAKMKRASFLEKEAMASTNGPYIGLRVRALSGLVPHAWRDKTEIGLGGTPGAPPIATTDVPLDAVGKFNQLLAEVNAKFRRGEGSR